MSLMSFGVVGALLGPLKRHSAAEHCLGRYLIRVLVTGAWPSLIQDYMVEPNELSMKRHIWKKY